MLTREQARGEILGYYVLYNIKSNSTLVNRTVDGKETTLYVITSLKEFTLYEFAMQAFNSKGVSQKSSVVEKKTDEDSKFIWFGYFVISHVYWSWATFAKANQFSLNFNYLCAVCNWLACWLSHSDFSRNLVVLSWIAATATQALCYSSTFQP